MKFKRKYIKYNILNDYLKKIRITYKIMEARTNVKYANSIRIIMV